MRLPASSIASISSSSSSSNNNNYLHHYHHHHDNLLRVNRRIATMASSVASMVNRTSASIHANPSSRLPHALHPANLSQGAATIFRDASEDALSPWSGGGAGGGLGAVIPINASVMGGSSYDSNSSDYVYDYDDSVNNLPVDELVVNAIGYGLALLLGLIGNILVVVSVARYRRMHNVTNIFLMSLASADLLLVCICIPVKCCNCITTEKMMPELCELRKCPHCCDCW